MGRRQEVLFLSYFVLCISRFADCVMVPHGVMGPPRSLLPQTKQTRPVGLLALDESSQCTPRVVGL